MRVPIDFVTELHHLFSTCIDSNEGIDEFDTGAFGACGHVWCDVGFGCVNGTSTVFIKVVVLYWFDGEWFGTVLGEHRYGSIKDDIGLGQISFSNDLREIR